MREWHRTQHVGEPHHKDRFEQHQEHVDQSQHLTDHSPRPSTKLAITEADERHKASTTAVGRNGPTTMVVDDQRRRAEVGTSWYIGGARTSREALGRHYVGPGLTLVAGAGFEPATFGL